MRVSSTILVVLMLGALPQESMAFSGFLQEAESGYVKLSFSTIGSNQLYLTSGELSDFGSDFRQSDILLYSEYGVLDFLTVGLNMPLIRFNSFDTSETATGLGDLQLFAKAGIEFWGFKGALMIVPEFPTGRSEANVDTDFEGVQTNLPTGDGEFNLWTRVALSRAFSVHDPLALYVSIFSGYNFRTGFTDQIDTGAEIGLGLFQRIWVQGRVSALFAPGSIQDFDPQGVFLFGEGTEYVAAGASASARLFDSPFWADLGFDTTFANLRNLYAGTTFSAGLSANW